MFTATLNILLYSLFEDRTLTKFTFTGANMYKSFSSKLVSYNYNGENRDAKKQRNFHSIHMLCFLCI